MADPSKNQIDSRKKYDNDVDRMINEGLAGGTIGHKYNKAQIEMARDLPKNDEPFPPAEEIDDESDVADS